MSDLVLDLDGRHLRRDDRDQPRLEVKGGVALGRFWEYPFAIECNSILEPGAVNIREVIYFLFKSDSVSHNF
jgi:hypothetical protein